MAPMNRHNETLHKRSLARKLRARRLRANGKKFREIAAVLGVSRARAEQLVKAEIQEHQHG